MPPSVLKPRPVLVSAQHILNQQAVPYHKQAGSPLSQTGRQSVTTNRQAGSPLPRTGRQSVATNRQAANSTNRSLACTSAARTAPVARFYLFRARHGLERAKVGAALSVPMLGVASESKGYFRLADPCILHPHWCALLMASQKVDCSGATTESFLKYRP